MASYHGKTGVIYLATTGTGVAVATVKLSAWTLNKNTDKAETSAFGDLNKTWVQGLPDVQGTLSGFFDDTNDALFDAAESADGGKLYLYPSSNAPSIYHYGPVWLDASINCPVNGPVTITASFAANGSWGRKP